jgi:BirA family transcriptional regulator, biotin operon repressor / biotin---[acetyl-CoA-carboxylase] ligase
MSGHGNAPAGDLAARIGLVRLDYHVKVTSTMDVAHALAEDGAPAGTMVLASSQGQGRGRSGRSWASEPDAGLWCTLIERPADVRALDVLALRVGLRLAAACDPLVESSAPVQLKWPNDLFVGTRKLAGILIEVRWRDSRPEWVAIGVGINRVVPASFPDVACIRANVTRDALLSVVAPALRHAARCTGLLSTSELDEWHRRDRARGRRATSPMPGVVEGITADGGLLVRGDDGTVQVRHSGSLVFSDD